MKTIWKFQIEKISDIIKIEMPINAEILTIQMQDDDAMIWAIVEPEKEKEVRYFEIFGTGHNMPTLDDTKYRVYIGTFQVYGGKLVFHLFELKRKLNALKFSSNHQKSNMDTV